MRKRNVEKIIKDLIWNPHYQRYWKTIHFYYKDDSYKVIGIEQEYYAENWINEYFQYLWNENRKPIMKNFWTIVWCYEYEAWTNIKET
jgi:hypothetical protein